MENDIFTYRRAKEDFRRARSKAAMQRFWAGIKGQPLDLLPYDEISSKLKAVSRIDRGLQMVKLSDIIGSVGRTDDFDRNFLPLRDSDIHRWASVKTAMTSMASGGLPPVTLYKMGDAYFVLDGNHRVSIAKDMGSEEIEAYVIEVKTKVPISSSITPEELVKTVAYSEFLEDTKVDQILPGVDLSLTLIDNYDLLKEHISVHRYYMGIEKKHKVKYAEALIHWYDTVYTPVVEIIKSSGLAQEFPGLTLTDLYLWVLDKQSQLQEDLGMPIQTKNVLEYAAQQEGKLPQLGTSVAEQRIDEVVMSSEESIAKSGISQPIQEKECLFQDILVAISDSDPEWKALEQAIIVDTCGDAQIRGLHVLTSTDPIPAEAQEAMRARFEERLRKVGKAGKLTFEQGDVSRLLGEQVLLSDLLVLKLTYPPGNSLWARFSSGMIDILRKSRRPVLLVKEKVLPFESLLLLYDGSPKSKEGLFISAYYASRNNAALHLFTMDEGFPDLENEVFYARNYLSKMKINFTYTTKKEKNFLEEVASLIDTYSISTIIMGGYSGTSFIDRLFGSAVDPIISNVPIPVLVCQ